MYASGFFITVLHYIMLIPDKKLLHHTKQHKWTARQEAIFKMKYAEIRAKS